MSDGSGWVGFTKGEALRAQGVRIGEPAVVVPRACPNCGRDDRWVRVQVTGDTPGRTDVVDGKLVAVPPQREAVDMRCYACGREYRFQNAPFTEQEQAARTAELWRQAKIGKAPL